MYEISEAAQQEYRRKWLEAERDLALMGVVPQSCESIDNEKEIKEENNGNQ